MPSDFIEMTAGQEYSRPPVEFVGPVCGNGSPASRRQRPVRLYALRCTETGRIKIGSSRDPEARHRTLRSLSSTRIELIAHCWASASTEQMVHKSLRRHRLHGEWYHVAPRVLAIIDAIEEGGWSLYSDSPLMADLRGAA